MTTPNYPVVMIGGPPNSGKSVLVKAITEALRKQSKAHYVLRATPDGEGDWFNAISPEHAKSLRQKGTFTPNFVERLERYLANPVFPLIVDVGGRPTDEQAAIFRHCTHAVLLVAAPGKKKYDDSGMLVLDESYSAAHAHWTNILNTQQVPLIVDLQSHLEGIEKTIAETPILKATICGLDRNKKIESQTLSKVVDQLTKLFEFENKELSETILAQLPAEANGVDLEEILPLITPPTKGRDNFWSPNDLIPLRERLSANEPLAIYGRAPIWAYGTLADWAGSAPLRIFDARLGWVDVPQLTQLSEDEINGATAQTGWSAHTMLEEAYTVLNIHIASQYLDIEDHQYLPIPELDRSQPILLSGKLPNWLWTSLVRGLRNQHPYVAIYQPQVRGGVVVSTTRPEIWPIGTTIPYNPPVTPKEQNKL